MSTKKCPQCAAEIRAEARFCAACGAPLTADVTPSDAQAAPSGRGTAGRDLAIVVGMLLVVVAAYTLLHKPQMAPSKPVGGQSQSAQDAHAGMDMGEMMAGLGGLPTDFDGLVTSGNRYMDEGNYPVAAECYRRALAVNPDAPNVRVDFGACLHGMGLPQRAVEELRVVLKDHPDHPIANFNLGVVYFGENDKDSARVYLEKYMALDPVGSAAEKARSYLDGLGAGAR
jgi:tetratricopeptide (TPR) repeat protein